VKLEEANVQVIELQATLKDLQPELVSQNAAVNDALIKVAEDSAKAIEQESVVSEETEKV